MADCLVKQELRPRSDCRIAPPERFAPKSFRFHLVGNQNDESSPAFDHRKSGCGRHLHRIADVLSPMIAKAFPVNR